MKRTAKLLALVLALATVMTFGLTFASAADSTITVKHAVPGQTYKIYKLLTVESYSDTNYVYTVTDGMKSYFQNYEYKDPEGTEPNVTHYYMFEVNTVTDGQGVAHNYVTYKGPSDTDTDPSKAQAMAAFAQDALTNSGATVLDTKTAPAAAQNEEYSSVVFDGLQPGWYLIDTSVGTLCIIRTVPENKEVDDKPEKPSVDKKVKDDETTTPPADYSDTANDSGIGEKVDYQTEITVKPGAQGYKLVDEMTHLTYVANSLAVQCKIGSAAAAPVTQEGNYTFEAATGGHGFTLTFENDYLKGIAPDKDSDVVVTLIITYQGKVDADAAIISENNTNVNPNKVTLYYGESKNILAGEDTVYTRVYDFNVFKHDGNNAALKDAEFQIHLGSASGTVMTFTQGTGDNANVYTYDAEATGGTTIKTDTSGKFTIKGLDEGDYYIIETKEPLGYNKLAGSIHVHIDNAGAVTKDGAATTGKTIDIENNVGAELPSTGSTGTKALVAIGSILVLVSVIFLVTKKKMSTYVA